MTPPLPSNIQNLGSPKAEYRANRLTARILLGSGIMSVLVSLFLFTLAISRSRAPRSGVLSDSFRRDSITINISLGIFMLLLAAFFFVYHRYHTGLRVAVYADGFVAGDWRKQLICRWDEAREVYESVTHVTQRTSGRPGPQRREYTVFRADGQRIKIAGLEGIIRLGQTLKAESAKHLLPRALESYRAGESVKFGPHLSLSQRGISDGTKTLPWGEVEQVTVSKRNNGVTIKQKGRRRAWKHIVGAEVANAWMIEAMVDSIQDENFNRFQAPIV